MKIKGPRKDYYRLNPTKEQRAETEYAEFKAKLIKNRKKNKFNKNTFWDYIKEYHAYISKQERIELGIEILKEYSPSNK